MTVNKIVNLRGMRRSRLLGSADPRHRREAQERFNPRADAEKAALEKRIADLEQKVKNGVSERN